MDQKNLTALSLLSTINGLGPAKILNLISKCGSPSDVLQTSYQKLCNVDLINDKVAKRIQSTARTFSEFEKIFTIELEKLGKNNFSIITYFDEEYPKILRNIYFPPMLLYVWGEISTLKRHNLAIVGTRRPTNYGKRIAEKITADLATNNICIVSGLARGIDSIAHRTSLKNGGKTIAVIGSGLDRIYPPENKDLAKEISESGIVVSEFPLGTKPDAQNFPRRNRIISGLSLGSIIIETNINGGAMQTAEYALDQNREVFAVPGNLESPQSEGTNILIQRGTAKLIKNAEDVLVELNLKLKPIEGKNIPKQGADLNMFEQKILDVLNSEPIQIDVLAEKLNSSTSDCLVNLLSLEFKGLVKQLPGKQFIKM